MNLETSFDFLAQLNDAEKGWGFWVDRDHIEQYHVGQYSFENDRLPKSFIHIDSLEHLAHERQNYLKEHLDSNQNSDEMLGKEWAKTVLSRATSVQ